MVARRQPECESDGVCRRGPRRSAPKPIGRGSLYSLSGVLFMVLTTEGKIMPPQAVRHPQTELVQDGQVWAPAPESRLSGATTPRRTSPFQGTVGEGPEIGALQPVADDAAYGRR